MVSWGHRNVVLNMILPVIFMLYFKHEFKCFIAISNNELFVIAMKHAEWVFGITPQTNEMESIVFPGICALWNALLTMINEYAD